MDYRQWRDEMRQAIARYMPRIQAVFSKSFQLELDTVTDEIDSAALRKAEETEPPLPRTLLELYASIGEASLEHLHNAYFIRPLAWVLESLHRSDIPAWAPEVAAERLAVFASDGGGRLFAVGYDSEAVFRLPVGGVANQVYDRSIDAIGPGEVAADLPDFLAQLLRIAQAFGDEPRDEDEKSEIL